MLRRTMLPLLPLRLPAVLALTVLIGGCAATHGMRPGEVQSASGLATLSSLRAAQGLPPVEPDPALEKAAAQQAAFMASAGKMKHTTGWGRDFASRMHANGIVTASAENVAYAGDVEKVFSLWAASPPHRRNLLDPRFTHFGLASASDGTGKRYWALVLGR